MATVGLIVPLCFLQLFPKQQHFMIIGRGFYVLDTRPTPTLPWRGFNAHALIPTQLGKTTCWSHRFPTELTSEVTDIALTLRQLFNANAKNCDVSNECSTTVVEFVVSLMCLLNILGSYVVAIFEMAGWCKKCFATARDRWQPSWLI